MTKPDLQERMGVNRGRGGSMYTKHITKAKMNAKDESRQEAYNPGGRKRDRRQAGVASKDQIPTTISYLRLCSQRAQILVYEPSPCVSPSLWVSTASPVRTYRVPRDNTFERDDQNGCLNSSM